MPYLDVVNIKIGKTIKLKQLKKKKCDCVENLKCPKLKENEKKDKLDSIPLLAECKRSYK